MITEIQKLVLLKRLTIEKLHEHECYASLDSLPFHLRKHFKKDIRIERAILRDINNRLVHLGFDL